MLNGFLSAFRTPDLRRKLLFTIGIIAIYRLGVSIPTPGVSYENVQLCLAQTSTNTGFEILNLFSGGALLQLSIFALGIMPYITASIMVQLLRVLIPRFETLYKEGAEGQAKLTQYTRYITLGFAAIQSASYITMARNGVFFPGCAYDIIPNDSWTMIAGMVLVMTAGTIFIMWLGERITERGVGNGMSLLIFTSIAASFPGAVSTIWNSTNGPTNTVLLALALLVVVAAIVFVEQSQRRIPVQYAKRMVGRKMLGGSSTYIPLKINMAGVIPVIFASSLLMIPQVIRQFQGDDPSGFMVWLENNVASPSAPLHIALYILLIVFFAYFYTAITFNPTEVADNMKKYGGFIPGIRPGTPTADFLDYVLSRITAAGAVYLAIVALIPTLLFVAMGVATNIPFGGTSLIILVGVGLDTVKRIQSQLEQRNYEGFLK
ncbi:preprotein translocase subunit SecY [Demequina sp. SYSU T00039]|uniref:Protein translocase subunit SecY n=1 Tax=Demequina lignilytica TaxID=3051663 RepID=A0AAW7M4Q1_9MICO|nr:MULTISPECIES: preprotein translocase subunit SecY [unclassified Demequina]MDN4478125.1 preprotein translocase subunit SecY [Demequina sp. SYSU T00039-1]MDN4488425.1 preprotein translocase subunit SecY [Demequina sp. SYSU T00039]MDN4490028.1 preprotein translocase subunit SecY [Demequina sp. SYSU T00068]